jgi:hypothetical protein
MPGAADMRFWLAASGSLVLIGLQSTERPLQYSKYSPNSGGAATCGLDGLGNEFSILGLVWAKKTLPAWKKYVD